MVPMFESASLSLTACDLNRLNDVRQRKPDEVIPLVVNYFDIIRTRDKSRYKRKVARQGSTPLIFRDKVKQLNFRENQTK